MKATVNVISKWYTKGNTFTGTSRAAARVDARVSATGEINGHALSAGAAALLKRSGRDGGGEDSEEDGGDAREVHDRKVGWVAGKCQRLH
jgi:hypothetical protein